MGCTIKEAKRQTRRSIKVMLGYYYRQLTGFIEPSKVYYCPDCFGTGGIQSIYDLPKKAICKTCMGRGTIEREPKEGESCRKNK